MKKTPLVRRLRNAIPLLAALALPFGGSLRADPTPTSLTLRPSGFDVEGLPAFDLEWNASSNATYGVQVSTNLETGAWETVDLVTPTGDLGSYKVPPSIRGVVIDKRLFFRLVLPPPQIFAVEPAVFAPGVPVDAHVIGQCFETNDVVHVDGVPVSGVIHRSHNLLQGPLPPLSAGAHLVELVRGGVVQSSFTVMCADPVANPELALQGPPDEPLASPYRVLKAKTKSNQSNDRVLKNKTKSNQSNDRLMGIGDVTSGEVGDADDSDDADFTLLMPSLTKVKEKANKMSASFKVSPFSGEVSAQSIDLVIPGRGLDFIWRRTYNSRIGRTGAATNGWTFSYDLHVQPLGGDLLIHDGTGRADRFQPGTNGVYTCPEFFSEGTLSNNVFTLMFADTGYWEFKPLTASADAGKLARIVDRNGNTVTLHYDVTGRLAQVVDDLDRTNTVAYNLAGQIESITDSFGRLVRYEYDGHGDLVACVSPPVIGTPNGNDFPGGKTNTYTYSSGYLDDRENHLLLTVRDANGQIQYDHVYQHNQTNLEFLRCISVQRWTNAPTAFSYLPQSPSPANGFATLRCVVNDPVGNVTAISTDARGRCVKLEEFTGRATPGTPVTNTASLPVKKLRFDDPASYVTTFTWNEDSLCMLVVLPDGSREETVHQRAFNQNSSRSNNAKAVLHNGDVRVIRQRTAPGVTVDFDGDGLADATERVWRFEYDERFGSPATCSGKMLYVGNLPYSRGHGGYGDTVVARTSAGVTHEYGFASGPGQTGELKFRARFPLVNNAFVTSATDPRGNGTRAEYDANGNCTEVRSADYVLDPQNKPRVTMSYNPHGQLTAITKAADATGRRSVDTLVFGDDPFTPQVEPPVPFAFMVVTDDGPGGLHLTNRFSYDARGNLTRAVDPLGHDWLYTYNALDQCVRVQTPTNIVSRCATDFYYDANDDLVQTATELRYTGDSHICTVARHSLRNPLGLVTSVVIPVDCTTFMTNDFVYDGNDQCVLELGPGAISGADPHQTMAYQYDERGMLYRIVAAPGSADQSTTQFDYDSNGNAIRVSVGLEGTPSMTTMEYDGFAGYAGGGGKAQGVMGQKAKAWMVNNFEVHPVAATRLGWVETVWNKQCVENDTTVRLSRVTDPMGNVTTFHYDANDNLRLTRHFGETSDVPGTNINVRLAESRFSYDGLDRLSASHEAHFSGNGLPIGDGYRTTACAFAPNGQCTAITDDLGRVTTFAYDTAGRAVGVTSPNQKTSFAKLLDAGGRATNCVQTDRSDIAGPPQVFAWTNVFDSLGRCVSSTDNGGNDENWDFDSLSRCVKHTDANGVASFFGYDLLGRETVSVRDLNGNGVVDADDISTSTYWVDADPRWPSSIVDSHGNTTSYAYDSLGRTTSITNADGTRHSLVWSPRSNLISETDANGTVATYTYDANDRCTTNQITPGAGVALTTLFEAFSYDGSSRLVTAANDVSSSSFTFDSHDNLVSEMRNGLTTSSSYDALGNRLSLTYPGGRALTYNHNALNRCTNIAEFGASLVSFDYDSPARLARISYANGMRTRIFYNGLAGRPNASGDFGHGQVQRIVHAMSGGSPIVNTLTLAWDRNQNQIQREDAIFQPAIPRTNTMVLDYDAADRLVESVVVSNAVIVRDTVYGLDRLGNRTNVTGALSCSGSYFMDALVPGPLDFQMNQYTATPCDSRTYDEGGNLTSRSSAVGPTTYQYDYAGRLVLVQAFDPNSGALAPLASYAYDALGRRIAKTVFDSSGLPPVTTEFYHDGGSVIEERQNGVVLATQVKDADNEAGCDMGQTFTHTWSMQRNGKDYFHHSDDQGNVLALTTAGGAVVERYDYDDYGAVTFLTSDGIPNGATKSVVGNPYCWGGRLDDETGLLNDDAGDYYEPSAGRFINGRYMLRAGVPIRSDAAAKSGTFGEKVNQGLHAAGSMRAGISTSRSNIRTRASFQDDGSGGGAGGSRAQDHNSSRSNKSGINDSDGRIVRKMIPVTVPDITGAQRELADFGGRTKAQDHNSSRSNKSGLAGGGGFGGGGSGKLKQLLYKAKQGKTGSASGK